jgi:hypothetical protein
MSSQLRFPVTERENEGGVERSTRLWTGLRLLLGGAVLGALAGVFLGALLGTLLGAVRGDLSLGLDGAVYGSVLSSLLGVSYGLAPALKLWRGNRASTRRR